MRGSGSATLAGCTGHDTLIDGRTYMFGHGYGTDTIVEHDPSNALYFPAGSLMRFSLLPMSCLAMSGGNARRGFAVAFHQGTYLLWSNIGGGRRSMRR